MNDLGRTLSSVRSMLLLIEVVDAVVGLPLRGYSIAQVHISFWLTEAKGSITRWEETPFY